MTTTYEHDARGYAGEYADAILRRGRVPMEPASFTPDWADRPRKWKHYPGTDSLPLPAGDAGSLSDGLAIAGPAAGTASPFTLSALGGMLRDTYGLLGRRLAVQANTDLAALPAYPKANWHRGAASGGGLYPVSVYWVAGPGAPVLPGVYHYAPHHHALRPLLSGDVTAEVRSALGGAEGEQFLVLGVKYWQNAFKYNSFCFHAVSMDVGAAAQAMRTWARAAGLAFDPVWFFDEARLSRLLGIDDAEGLFAVVPLPWAGPARRRPLPAATGAGVRHRDAERSRRVLTFPTVERMHLTTRQDGPGEPAPGVLGGAAVSAGADRGAAVSAGADRGGRDSIVLPPPADLTVPVRTALRRRRSSFGRFDARTPLSGEALATALAAAGAAARDTLAADDLMGLYVYANHVEGVPPGTYRYARGQLRPVDPHPPGSFLQRSYFLANYNLERAGAVVVPTMRTHAVIEAVGDRGYRLVNAAVGAVAQNVYVAGAGLDVGCGVALGFDNVSFVEQLRLTGGEVPLLLMMLGADRPGSADFRYEIDR